MKLVFKQLLKNLCRNAKDDAANICASLIGWLEYFGSLVGLFAVECCKCVVACTPTRDMLNDMSSETVTTLTLALLHNGAQAATTQLLLLPNVCFAMLFVNISHQKYPCIACHLDCATAASVPIGRADVGQMKLISFRRCLLWCQLFAANKQLTILHNKSRYMRKHAI
jgi:hypothetical protein